MRILIIKTSSMGDIIHTLPALTDAGKAHPGITFDWVVEENFAEIPRWHPLVKNVIPVALRRWRQQLFSQQTRQEWRIFRNTLQQNQYDLVIDAQGLLKSAGLSFFAFGKKCGLSWQSARESIASLFYRKTAVVEKNQHAIMRVRDLFSQVLAYPKPDTLPDYGINRALFAEKSEQPPYLVFLHGTTWATKHWPEAYWKALVDRAALASLRVKLVWGNAEEKARAERLSEGSSHVDVLPRLGLSDIAKLLANARAIVAVDTGLGHLAAALNVSTVSLYSSSNPALTGLLGQNQKQLAVQFPCSPCFGRECTYREPSPLNPPSPLKSLVTPPCFATLPPSLVWAELSTLL